MLNEFVIFWSDTSTTWILQNGSTRFDKSWGGIADAMKFSTSELALDFTQDFLTDTRDYFVCPANELPTRNSVQVTVIANRPKITLEIPEDIAINATCISGANPLISIPVLDQLKQNDVDTLHIGLPRSSTQQ